MTQALAATGPRSAGARAPRSTLPAAVLALLLGFAARPLHSQQAAREPIATLGVWADRVWLALLDRDGSWHGRLSDEGILQRFNPAQDDEYELDLRTSLFSPSEDARWTDASSGLRAAAGSIDHPHIVQDAEWRDVFPIASAWALDAGYVRERTLSARRDHLRTGLLWTPPGERWRAGAALGLHFFKPSADVELFWSAGWERPGSAAETTVTVALLDAFNDVVFGGLGVEAEDADAHFDYRTLPLALRVDAGARAGEVRIEARGGLTRRSTVRVTFPAAGEAPYDLTERVAFAGVLVEWHAGSRTSLAAQAAVADAETERRGDAPSGLDLRLEEVTRSAGVRARQALGGPWAIEADGAWTERPEAREIGWRLPGGSPSGSTPDGAHDREWFAGAALLRRAPTGWTGRLFYAWMDRRSERMADELTARNQRLVTEGGYRFASGFEVTAGVRWDLDNLGGVPFDGGQLRFTTAVRP